MIKNTKTTSILKINGMKCHNCAGRVEQEVKLLAGVYEVAVDLAAKTATVTYDAPKLILKVWLEQLKIWAMTMKLSKIHSLSKCRGYCVSLEKRM